MSRYWIGVSNMIQPNVNVPVLRPNLGTRVQAVQMADHTIKCYTTKILGASRVGYASKCGKMCVTDDVSDHLCIYYTTELEHTYTSCTSNLGYQLGDPDQS